MNGVAARMLCSVTASSRFHGDMNVDMNEIFTNLVPFPRLHFLMTALSPQRPHSSVGGNTSTAIPKVCICVNCGILYAPLHLDFQAVLHRSFADVMSTNGQLCAASPYGGNLYHNTAQTCDCCLINWLPNSL
jgi:hypothetical protein